MDTVSRRTRDLPPLSGIPRLVRELRYHEFSRQGLGLVLMALFALLSEPLVWAFVAGAALAVTGMLVRFYASGYIVKNRELATDGPYSVVRHPLYTGNLLLLVGFSAASGRWWAFLLAALFWWFYYPPAIEYEDRKLGRLFGDRWQAWSRSVPAVIPRQLRLQRAAQWSLRTSLKRNAEPLVMIYTLFWLLYIGRRL